MSAPSVALVPPASANASLDSKSAAIALVPSTLESAWALAEWLSKSSGLNEKLRGKPADIFSILLAGVELGLPPMAALRGIYVVNGKTACEGRTKMAVCLQKGIALYVRRVEYTELATTWETQRRGTSEPVRMRYTLKEAENAGLTRKDGPWRNYSQRMISHRALGWLLDDVYPDVLMGIASSEDEDEDDGIGGTFQSRAAIGAGVEIGKIEPRASDWNVPPSAAQTAPEPASASAASSPEASPLAAAESPPPPATPPTQPAQRPATTSVPTKPATNPNRPLMSVEKAEELKKEMRSATTEEALQTASKKIAAHEMGKSMRDELLSVHAEQKTMIRHAHAAGRAAGQQGGSR